MNAVNPDMQPYCVLIHPSPTNPGRYELELRPLTDAPHPQPCEGHHAGISTESLTEIGAMVDGKIVDRARGSIANMAAKEMLWSAEYRANKGK